MMVAVMVLWPCPTPIYKHVYLKLCKVLYKLELPQVKWTYGNPFIQIASQVCKQLNDLE